MKKLLGILVLGLLLSSNAYALKLSNCYLIKTSGDPELISTEFDKTRYEEWYYEIFQDVVQILSESGLLVNANSFQWVANRKNYTQNIKAGKYFINGELSNNELVNLLRSGEQIPVRVTFNNLRTKEQLAGKISAQIEADSIAIMNQLTDTTFLLETGLNANNVTNHVYTYPGGNMPQWSINRLFELITKGKVNIALLAGGETLATQKQAQRMGIKLDWNEDPGGNYEEWGINKRGWSTYEENHGMKGAIYAYPLIENAIRGIHKRTIKEHNIEMGKLLSKFSTVAKNNPLADRRKGYSAEEISNVDNFNVVLKKKN